MEEVIKKKNDEIGVLKAKLCLNLFDFKVEVVAEYPDLVDENYSLEEEIKTLN